MTDDLIAWLRAQLDDDERVARAAIAATGWDRKAGVGRWRSDRGLGPDAVADEGGDTVVYDEGLPTEEQAEHIARHDPARVLAEVDAKRRIVNWHDVQRDDRTPWGDPVQICRCGYDLPCSTLRLLALPYADRPGYRDEWRP